VLVPHFPVILVGRGGEGERKGNKKRMCRYIIYKESLDFFNSQPIQRLSYPFRQQSICISPSRGPVRLRGKQVKTKGNSELT